MLGTYYGRAVWRLSSHQHVFHRCLPRTKASFLPSLSRRIVFQQHNKPNIVLGKEFSTSRKRPGRIMEFIQTSPLTAVGSISLAVIVPSICGAYTLFYMSPEIIVWLGFKYQMFKCGMKEKYVQSGDKVICYGEKNTPSPDRPTVVFLHGFTSSKLQWLAAFNGLRPDCHLVAMELPGHGNSSMPRDDEDLDIDFMESTVLKFLESVGLGNKKIHLVGISLGGALAGIVAARNPDKVSKVTMVCPAMNTPVATDFLLSLKKSLMKDPSKITYSDCVLLPQDLDGMKEMFRICLYNKEATIMHDQFYQGILNLRLPKNEFFLKFYKSTNSDENLNLLAKHASSITVPSQVIWGKHDEIMDVSGAEFLKKRLPNCKYMDVVDRCGHAVDVDRPGSLCKLLETFILDKSK